MSGQHSVPEAAAATERQAAMKTRTYSMDPGGRTAAKHQGGSRSSLRPQHSSAGWLRYSPVSTPTPTTPTSSPPAPDSSGGTSEERDWRWRRPDISPEEADCSGWEKSPALLTRLYGLWEAQHTASFRPAANVKAVRPALSPHGEGKGKRHSAEWNLQQLTHRSIESVKLQQLTHKSIENVKVLQLTHRVVDCAKLKATAAAGQAAPTCLTPCKNKS